MAFAEPVILVQPDRSTPGLVELRSLTALTDWVQRQTPAMVLILENPAGPVGGPWADWRQQSRDRYLQLQSFLLVTDPEAPVSEAEALATSLSSGVDTSLTIVHLLANKKILYVSANGVRAQILDGARNPNQLAIDVIRRMLVGLASDLSTRLTSQTALEQVADLIRTEERAANAKSLKALADSAQIAVRSNEPEAIGRILRSILDRRAAQRETMVVAAQLAVAYETTAAIVAEVVSDLDAVATFLTSYQLLRLYEQGAAAEQAARTRTEELDALQASEAARQQVREERIARYAAALVVPSIYVSFWSTTVTPEKIGGLEVEGPFGLLVVAGGAALIALLFWFGIPLVSAASRRKRD